MRKEGLGGSAPRQEKISHSKLVVFFAYNNIRETKKKSSISNLDFFIIIIIIEPLDPHRRTVFAPFHVYDDRYIYIGRYIGKIVIIFFSFAPHHCTSNVCFCFFILSVQQ